MWWRISFSLHICSICLVGAFHIPLHQHKKPTLAETSLFSFIDQNDEQNFPSFKAFNFKFQDGYRVLASFALTFALTFLPYQPVDAAGYTSMTDEAKFVAESWREVDNSYLDRTFNGLDWFQLRQSLVKKKYKNMEEARSTVEEFVSSLGDRYTRYLPPAKYQSIVDSATGTLAGVGIEISVNKQDRVIASDVEAGSPAAAAGVKPDDIFLQVDGTKFDTTSTPDDVAVKLRGEAGSKVGVTMERVDGSKVDYIITRAPIKITSVKSYMSSVSGVGKVGVIRIKSFSSTTEATVKEVYSDLIKKGAKAVVFDIRGNPGGLLPGGVDTASLFLPSGKPVVFVVSKTGVVDKQVTLKDGIDLSTPLVVLVDGQTASAAEVFTAALKENEHRAIIVGEKTFGKGIIQTIRPLSNNNGGIAITVARYETPDHIDINKEGVAVDRSAKVECPKNDATACLNDKMFQQL